MRNFQLSKGKSNENDDPRKLRTSRAVLVYARRSDPYAKDKKKDRTQSREMQTDDMIGWAKDQGWTEELIHPYFADLGLSGTLRPDQRPDMLRLFGDLDENKFDHATIVCFQENRLFRDETHIYYNQLIEKMLLHDVVLIALSPRMYIYDMRDEHDKERLRDKLEEAAEFIPKHVKGWLLPARERAAQEYGEWAGIGDINIGYIVDYDEDSPTYKKRIPYAPHAEVVKQELFEAFSELGGEISLLYQRVALSPVIFPFFEPWVDRRVVNKFNQWTQNSEGYVLQFKQTILSILTNPVYAGYQMINGAIRRDKKGNLIQSHEAIIDRDLFDFAFYRLSKYDLDGTLIEGKSIRRYFYRGEEKNNFGLLKYRIRWSEGPVRTSAIGKYDDDGTPTNKAVYILYSDVRKMNAEEYAYIPCEVLDDIVVKRLMHHAHELTQQQNDISVYELQAKLIREKRKNAINQIDKSIADNQGEQLRLTESLGKVDEVVKSRKNLSESEIEEMKEHLQAVILGRIASLELDRKKLIKDKEMLEKESQADIGSLEEELADLENLWSEYPFKKRQAYVNFLIKGVVVDVVSNHWMSIQVSWLHEMWGVEEIYYYRRRGGHSDWTQEEDEIIRQYYPCMPKMELMALLPLRVWAAIIKRAVVLEVSRSMSIARTTREKIGFHPQFSHSDVVFMREMNIPLNKRGEPVQQNTEWQKPQE